MARFLPAAIFMACFLSAGTAFAAGGTCPSGANYLNSSNGTFGTLESLGITSCYYIAANGSDSNSGASESSPWLHAPGMSKCSGNCASNSPTAGNGYILRGGDTWHFGNSSASPYTGGEWTFSGTGTSSAPIYVGVDQTWYSGSAWTRPVLNADNPLTTHPGTWGDTVSSCPYQTSSDDDILVPSGNYLIFDNFELTGICQKSESNDNVNVEMGGLNHSIMQNLYIHGWSHLPYTGGLTLNIMAFHGGSGNVGNVLDSDVVDGSDSDPSGSTQFYVIYGIWKRDVFRYVATGSTTSCHLIQDTLWEYIFSPSDNSSHGDTLLCISELSGVNAYYNFIMRYNYLSEETQPNFWIGPQSGTTDYIFNALMYGSEGGIENFNIQNSGGGPAYIFNSTIQLPGSSTLIDCEGGSLTHVVNTHLITDASSPYYGGGTCSTGTNLLQTNAGADANTSPHFDQYTGSETYAYSPLSSTNSTVGAGANETSTYCAALSTAAASDSTLTDAAAACGNDTRYACTYNSTNHTVSCPARTVVARPATGAWDIGAYQYAGTESSLPNPATDLTALVQ